MFKSFEDLQKFGKDQFEAATQSATALTNGLQQIVAETTDFSRKSFEANTDAVQRLMGTKSVDRAFQVQFDYAKAAYDSMMAETSKIGGMLSATAQEAYKPLENALAQAQNVVRTTAAPSA